jgi:uncharacterized protein YjbI with pentapeptide repeats
MAFGTRRSRTVGLAIALAVTGMATAGSLAIAAGPASADVVCPTVDPTTHLVTPAPASNVDWSGCPLAGADLWAATLTGADLNGANLTGADLDHANLTDADLGLANLDGAFLNYAVITGADIGGAKLTGATWVDITSGGLTGGSPDLMTTGWTEDDGYLIGPEANVASADLSGADLAGIDLSGASFAGATLTGANLTGIALNNGSFADANLTNANLTNANLAGVNIAGGNFTSAVLYGVSSGGVTGTATLPANWHLVGPNGYLIGPGADLAAGNLVETSMIGADLRGADLSGADLTNSSLAGADLTDADLAGITAQPTNFGGATMTDAELQKAYIYGSNLDNANLTDANLTDATLTDDSVTGTIWTGATCPDGTQPDQHAPVGCTTPLDKTPPSAHPAVTAGTRGADGWYTSPVTVAWHWTDAGEINQAACTTSTTSSGNGPQTLSATCTDMAGNKGKASYQVKVDSTKPVVSVTGVTSGARYVYGKVPAAGCATTDVVSGVATRASVKIITTGKNGTGAFTATCAGAVSVAGAAQAAPVRVGYTVVYGFGGFAAPAPKATLKKSAAAITVKFRLATATGTPISASVAAALAAGRDVLVTLRGPGIAATTGSCGWSATAKIFQCAIKTPKGIKTGKAAPYTITAYENVGPGFVPAPATANPETIYFR